MWLTLDTPSIKIIKGHKCFSFKTTSVTVFSGLIYLSHLSFLPRCGTLYAMENRSQTTHQEQGEVVEPTCELRTLNPS